MVAPYTRRWTTWFNKSVAQTTPADAQFYQGVEDSLAEVSTGLTGRKQYRVSDLFALNPFYVAHRGGGDERPEHTLTSYEGAINQGLANAIEVSVHQAADGTLYCMHDSTLNRTTNSTGSGLGRTYADLKNNVAVAMQPYLGSAWANQPIPTLREVLDRYAGRVVIFLEEKEGTTGPVTAMLNLMDQYNCKDSFIFKTYRNNPSGGLPPGAIAAQARGYKVWAYVDATDSSAIVTATAAGTDYLGVPVASSDAFIQAAVAFGKPVITWAVSRRSQRDRHFGFGVQGMMSSAFRYVSTSAAMLTASSFGSGLRAAGDMTTADNVGLSPIWTASEASVQLALNSSLMLGSMCPLANAAGSYSIAFDMQFTSLPGDTTLHGDFVFGQSDDSDYVSATSTNGPGYHLICRANGQIALYSHVTGSTGGTLLSSVLSTTAAVAATWISMRIDVTPTTITINRTDGTPASTSVTSNTYRGGYIHLSAGSSSTPVKFRNVVVS